MDLKLTIVYIFISRASVLFILTIIDLFMNKTLNKKKYNNLVKIMLLLPELVIPLSAINLAGEVIVYVTGKMLQLINKIIIQE
ncbi:MAG: hypothetical protein ACRC0G_03295, partial [Fusobacteriaceae bacterium]